MSEGRMYLVNSKQIQIAQDCARDSNAGTIGFGEIVRRLAGAGIERYHADYCRMDLTYYTPDGGSCVVPMGHESAAISPTFAAAQIKAAVRLSQKGELKYQQFTARALAAGCVGYFVQIHGQCVQYFGRHGEVHTEWFPGDDRRA